MLEKLRNERGMAIAVVLAILLMMALIGVASIQTSMIDMDISSAMTQKMKSFYLADGGLELAVIRMNQSPAITNVDSIMKFVNTDTTLGVGTFKIHLTNTYPERTVIAEGHEQQGACAVAMNVLHRRNPFNPWNNAIFAGVGKTGRGINGNVDIHGSVHILGEGEPFTDQNGDGVWNDADQFVDLNGNGSWQPGEPLSVDHDGDGTWDDHEPFVDENGSGDYDQTLTATDLSFEASGAAAINNNYDGMSALLSSRIPPLSTTLYNGEHVQTLAAELRVKHGTVNLSGTAVVGDPNVAGGIPAIKETMDAVFVNDGFGGTHGSANVYSDNGTSEAYDLGDGMAVFPSLNDTSNGFADHRTFLESNALIINGDLTLQPGVTYTSPLGGGGSLTVDANGKMRVSGVVIVRGNVNLDPGTGTKRLTPFEYEGHGTLVAEGDMNINTHVIARSDFPATNAMGFIAYQDMNIGTVGAGLSHLDLMGAFYAQQTIRNAKQNSLVGAMVSNYFEITEVPSIYHVPALAEHLPPGMPGGTRYTAWWWRPLEWTWHEL